MNGFIPGFTFKRDKSSSEWVVSKIKPGGWAAASASVLSGPSLPLFSVLGLRLGFRVWCLGFRVKGRGLGFTEASASVLSGPSLPLFGGSGFRVLHHQVYTADRDAVRVLQRRLRCCVGGWRMHTERRQRGGACTQRGDRGGACTQRRDREAGSRAWSGRKIPLTHLGMAGDVIVSVGGKPCASLSHEALYALIQVCVVCVRCRSVSGQGGSVIFTVMRLAGGRGQHRGSGVASGGAVGWPHRPSPSLLCLKPPLLLVTATHTHTYTRRGAEAPGHLACTA